MHSRVAVIIRTKNRGRLLARALDSVLSQTFTDWCIVLVNDGGSHDQVDEALRPRLSRLGDKLVRLDNETSLGMEAASNLGIRAVESQYVAVHDDDDEWDADFLATTVAYLEDHPEQGGVSVETEIVFERLTPDGREVEERVPLEPQMREITLVDLLHYNRFVPISFLFRRSIYDELGGFDENLAVVGDWEFHLRFLVHHQIGLIKGRPLAFWNQRRSARNSEANSVISGLDEHHFYSLKVRDRLVREHAQEYGLGPLLYQRELLAVEAGRVHVRMDEMQRNQSEGVEQISRMVNEVEHLRRAVWAASQPLPLRAVRSVRRRLSERRAQRQRSMELHASRQHSMLQPEAGERIARSIAILGDVGQHEYHVGDEAMAHAAIAALQKRGFDNFVVLTHDVEQTSRLYGQPAAKRPQVPWNAYERHQLLQDVKKLLAGGTVSQAAGEVVRTFQDAFNGCSALLLAGGGNLTSQYGGLLFERLAAIKVAHSMGLKVLVSGQTVGPVLTDADRTEVTEALSLCHLVGSRERHTQDLLSSLCIDSLPVLDDATFFSPGVEDESTDRVPSSYIAATFAPASGAMPREEYHRHMARLLDLAYEHLQLPILLLPHVSTFGESNGDQACHAAIARLSKAPNILVLDQKLASETAALTAGAELIITSRYHPVIFGLSAGVPILPVAVDYYGEVRIGGALESWGLRPLLRSLRHLGDGADVTWVNSVLSARSDITTHLQVHGQKLRAFHDNWWETIDATLREYPVEEGFSTIPVPDTGVSLVLEHAESGAAARLNASNEIAIGNLAQHSDWLQGQLAERARQSDPGSGFASASWGTHGFLVPAIIRAVERLAKRALRTGTL